MPGGENWNACSIKSEQFKKKYGGTCSIQGLVLKMAHKVWMWRKNKGTEGNL